MKRSGFQNDLLYTFFCMQNRTTRQTTRGLRLFCLAGTLASLAGITALTSTAMESMRRQNVMAHELAAEQIQKQKLLRQQLAREQAEQQKQLQKQQEAGKQKQASEEECIHQRDQYTLPDGSRICRIQPGDTLTSLSTALGFSVQELAGFNAISDPDWIYAGSVLRIPE